MANDRTITVVLGGGRGTRLHPLTADRAKPAVPLGGKYRLIDIPVSNSINSGLREIFVLTQFNSASLNSHLTKSYRFDPFSRGFVEVLAAEQTQSSGDWYQGTADAVRRQLRNIDRDYVDHVLILSGDHLYRMDYGPLIERHVSSGAEITVGAIPMHRDQCDGLGVLRCDPQGLVRGFKEKPTPGEDISDLIIPRAVREHTGMGEREYLASMGIYVFKMSALREWLATEHIDFGKHILPGAVAAGDDVAAFVYHGYWEDIGTIEAFYESNLALTEPDPNFRFFDARAPIYTRQRFLPASKLWEARVSRAMIADGCLIFDATIQHSIIGLRSRLQKGCEVIDSIVMGADYYEDDDLRARLYADGAIPMGIGRDASIKRAIIDKNARIGEGAIIHGHPDRPDEDHDSWVVRDGIIVVAKGAVIPAGAKL